MKKIIGLTLIESMLAITIGILILGCLISIYSATEKNQQIQIALNTLQENIRIAVKLLQSDIRLAGHIGCARLQNNFSVIAYLPYELTAENKIQEYHDDLSEIKPDTDAIIIRHANPVNAILLKNMQSFSSLLATSAPTFSENDILMISDCHSAELFEVKKNVLSDGQQRITTIEPIHKQYEKFSEISRFSANTYFIGKTERVTMKGEPIYALYVNDLFQRKTELIEGVDDMKIHYVIEDNNQVKEMLSSEINDWSKIIAVSIELTLSSQNYFSLKKKFYFYTALK